MLCRYGLDFFISRIRFQGLAAYLFTFGARGIDHFPIIRSGAARNNDRFAPTDLINDQSAAAVRNDQRELVCVPNPFKPIAASDFPRLRSAKLVASAKAG